MSDDFVVHDKRLFTKDGQVNPEATDAVKAESKPAEEKAPSAEDIFGPTSFGGHLPPANFAGLLVGLATSAFIHLGENPDGDEAPPDLPAAKHAIDLLAVLQAKTQGHLTGEEEALLTTLLYDLHLKFVQASSRK